MPWPNSPDQSRPSNHSHLGYNAFGKIDQNQPDLQGNDHPRDEQQIIEAGVGMSKTITGLHIIYTVYFITNR